MKKVLLLSVIAFVVSMTACSTIPKEVLATKAVIEKNKYQVIIAIDGRPVDPKAPYYAVTQGAHTLSMRQVTNTSLLGAAFERAVMNDAQVSHTFFAGKKYKVEREGMGFGTPKYIVKQLN